MGFFASSEEEARRKEAEQKRSDDFFDFLNKNPDTAAQMIQAFGVEGLKERGLTDKMADLLLRQHQNRLDQQARQSGAISSDPSTGQNVDPNTGQPLGVPSLRGMSEAEKLVRSGTAADVSLTEGQAVLAGGTGALRFAQADTERDLLPGARTEQDFRNTGLAIANRAAEFGFAETMSRISSQIVIERTGKRPDTGRLDVAMRQLQRGKPISPSLELIGPIAQQQKDWVTAFGDMFISDAAARRFHFTLVTESSLAPADAQRALAEYYRRSGQLKPTEARSTTGLTDAQNTRVQSLDKSIQESFAANAKVFAKGEKAKLTGAAVVPASGFSSFFVDTARQTQEIPFSADAYKVFTQGPADPETVEAEIRSFIAAGMGVEPVQVDFSTMSLAWPTILNDDFSIVQLEGFENIVGAVVKARNDNRRAMVNIRERLFIDPVSTLVTYPNETVEIMRTLSPEDRAFLEKLAPGIFEQAGRSTVTAPTPGDPNAISQPLSSSDAFRQMAVDRERTIDEALARMEAIVQGGGNTVPPPEQ
ncbi:MAG: hypothetical protein V3S43_06395 [Acidimicrobiia bacterium]